jgi:hypothetical protein
MVSDYEVYVDDTMPLPADVEREFLDKGTDQVSALAWLDELEIDPGPSSKRGTGVSPPTMTSLLAS